ncbi:hypothetical protein QFC21_000654 [Naganishia friedmannii]|uniref:Uncharacterized protein n=1 Tax=Naganishia friedmannii TaxID=89922 RepID=A0ACC2WDA3_9TREE|nr:hypothetical protein QFC21_000654 [Naganishia friedmannii]
MNRCSASGSHNDSRSASPLARISADSDDTQSLTSELSRVSMSISESSEKSIAALAKTGRRDSGRAPFDGKETAQGNPTPGSSNAIRGGRLVKQRPAEGNASLSTHAAIETPKWKRSNADRSATSLPPPSRNVALPKGHHSAQSRPGWEERTARKPEQQRYETRSRTSATNEYDTRLPGSRKPTSNFPFRDGPERKSESLMNEHKSSPGMSQARSTEGLYLRDADNGVVVPSTSAYRSATSNEFKPISQPSKLPLHLQHPFRLLPSGTTFDIIQALESEQVTERHPTPEYFELASKSPNVYHGNDLDLNPVESRKLVILDLNGAMLVRSQRSNNSAANTKRRVYPRPFLDAFLNYIFAPAPPETAKSSCYEPDIQDMRPYEAFVWSSAQPVNVDSMIRFAFGKWAKPASPDPQERVESEEWISRIERAENRPGRILGVWTRDEMDLTRQQYGRKSTTYKDLSKVFNHFAKLSATHAEQSRFYRPDPDFTPPTNSTLLIDDSTIKACMQPFNHIPIPEFDLDSLRRGDIVVQDAKHRCEGEAGEIAALNGYDDKTKENARILRMIFGSSASEFYSRHGRSDSHASISTEQPPTLDGILLGVVGILSEVKDVVNLPAWIAAGGLLPDVRHSFTQDTATRGWENLVFVDSKLSAEAENGKPDAGTSGLSNHQVPTLLPSHPNYMHWYQSPLHLLYWVRRGLLALTERGIEVLE